MMTKCTPFFPSFLFFISPYPPSLFLSLSLPSAVSLIKTYETLSPGLHLYGMTEYAGT